MQSAVSGIFIASIDKRIANAEQAEALAVRGGAKPRGRRLALVDLAGWPGAGLPASREKRVGCLDAFCEERRLEDGNGGWWATCASLALPSRPAPGAQN